MQIRQDEVEFEWDEGNRNKIFERHGITVEEAESVFKDKNSVVLPDVEHSQNEERFVIVGKDLVGKKMHMIFTMRGNKIRVISARRMHKKEVARYEKIKKDPTL